jgi:hypothetical protein
MKKSLWLFLFVVPAVFLLVKMAKNPPPRDYDVEYTKAVIPWTQKQFVSLRLMDAAVSRLGGMEFGGENALTEAQRGALTNSIADWWRAYSAGDQTSYLAFRFPPNAPWKWKDGALQTISNYFRNGIVFSSDFLEGQWMRKYGHPDNLTNFVMYEELVRERELSDVEWGEARLRWIAKYGDGSTAKSARHPQDPMDQWLTIACEQSGTNWWKDYWTGVCLDELVVEISQYREVPPPLHKFDFGIPHRRAGRDVDANFPNMGFSRMDRKSYIEWNFSYDDLLQESGKILTANIYCMFQRQPPEYPEPALLRLVWVDKLEKWLPFELVDAHIIKTYMHTLYF